MELLLFTLALLGILALNTVAWLVPFLLRVFAATLAFGLHLRASEETETRR
jgi:hypothetical protein